MPALQLVRRTKGRSMCNWFSCDSAMRGKRRSGRYRVFILGHTEGVVCEQHAPWLVELWKGALGRPTRGVV